MLPKYDLVLAFRQNATAEPKTNRHQSEFIAEVKKALGSETSCFLSIDLETTGKHEGCGVISIGMVPMLDDGTILQDLGFYAKMNFTEVMANHPCHPGTIRWHLEQSDAVRSEMLRYTGFGTGREEECLRAALEYAETLRSAMAGKAELLPIGNDPSFDCSILKRAWLDAGLIRVDPKGEENYPWLFWNECSLRQMIRDASLVRGSSLKHAVTRGGTHHNAFDDALHQATVFGTGLRWLLEARKSAKELADLRQASTSNQPE